MAEANQIGVVFSNPCFEIWPLLHLHPHTSHIERDKLQRLLKKKMRSYDHRKNPVIDYQLIESEYEVAKARALQLDRLHKDWQTPKGNPYTDFHSLLESIKRNGQG